jgi:hypothetical protein
MLFYYSIPTVKNFDFKSSGGKPIMNHLKLIGWLSFAAFVAWFAYNHSQEKRLQDCQHYDSLGRGIGCEGSDLGDM